MPKKKKKTGSSTLSFTCTACKKHGIDDDFVFADKKGQIEAKGPNDWAWCPECLPNEKHQYVFCHVREIRTFITVTAEDLKTAEKRSQEVLDVGGYSGEVEPEWLNNIETDDSDEGELEFREER